MRKLVAPQHADPALTTTKVGTEVSNLVMFACLNLRYDSAEPIATPYVYLVLPGIYPRVQIPSQEALYYAVSIPYLHHPCINLIFLIVQSLLLQRLPISICGVVIPT